MGDNAATFADIHDENEFYSQHYVAEIFTGDIRDTIARWRVAARATADCGCAGCLAIEVDVLDVINPTDRSIVAFCLEHFVGQRIVLQVEPIDDQGESVDGHLRILVYPRTPLVQAAGDRALR